MNALSSRGVLVGVVLIAIGSFLVGCRREAVPQYFGIYFESPQGLREIPMKGDPAYNAAVAKLRAAIATKNPDEIRPALKGFYDSCQTATEQPVFILYHETIKPQMLHFQRVLSHVTPQGTAKEEVDLGVTPVADKQFMYRVTPKQPVSKDLYDLVGSSEFVSNKLACFLVGPRDEILEKAPAPAAAGTGTADKFSIQTPKGKVAVIDFRKHPARVTQDQQTVVIEDKTDFQIVFNVADTSFTINVNVKPFPVVRKDAEAAFLMDLGISKDDACRLSAYEGTTIHVDPNYAGRSFKLSFCTNEP